MKIILCLFFLSLNSWAQEEMNISFENLRNYLEVNNGDIEASKMSVKATENRKGYLGRKFSPTFILEGGGETFSTGPYNHLTQPYGSAVLNFNLYNGSRDLFSNRIILTQIDQKKVEYNQTLMTSLLKLRKLFWQYLYEKEVIQILSMANEMNQKNLNSAMVRVRSGIATNTDQIEFEQNGIQVNQDLQRSKIELNNLEREMKALISAKEDVTLTSSDTIPHEHSDELLQEKFIPEGHRDNQWLSLEQNKIEQQRKLERNWWTPSFDVYAAAAHFTQKDRDYLTYEERNDLTVGMRLTLNIWDGGESYNQSKSYYLQRSAFENQSIQKRKELNADYKNSQALLELTHNQIHYAEENVKKSEQYYKNTMSEYSRGIKNSPDVLQASQRLVNSKLRLIELKKDYQVARATLMNVLGI